MENQTVNFVRKVRGIPAEYEPPRLLKLMTKYRSALALLSDAELGETVRALFSMIETGAYVESKSDRVKIAVEFIAPDIVADIRKQIDISEKRRAAINKRWEEFRKREGRGNG